MMDTELDEVEAIRRVSEQLKSSFSTMDPSVIDAAVTVAHRKLLDARIRTFVPIFVEREARATLNEIAP
jgi:hypothetical protein